MQSRSQVGMIVVEPYNRQHLLAMKIWAAWTHGEREHGWMDAKTERKRKNHKLSLKDKKRNKMIGRGADAGF